MKVGLNTLPSKIDTAFFFFFASLSVLCLKNVNSLSFDTKMSFFNDASFL